MFSVAAGMVGFQYEHGRRKRESETIYIEYMVVSDYKNTEKCVKVTIFTLEIRKCFTVDKY